MSNIFFILLKDNPKSPETTNMEKQDQVPHDETASEKSIPVTPTPRHTIELDRNVTIKLGNIF